jgi:twitching motility two-component system response regulator PilG
MSSKKIFAVAMIGIPQHERHVLVNIFKLSSHRTQTYTLASADEPRAILMVDADDPQAMTEWQRLRSSRTTNSTFSHQEGTHSSIPSVMVTKNKLSNISPYYIRRPFVATRVLSALDQVVIKEVNCSADRVIGEKPNTALITKKSLTLPAEEKKSVQALVVDDSKAVRKQIELELRLFNIHVDMAETGEQAFELLNQKIYDMVFLDVIMPGVDGYQVCKTIKRDKEKKQTPVIMLTGKSSPFDRVRGALAGCDTYLVKPVKQASFQKVVKKYLRQ